MSAILIAFTIGAVVPLLAYLAFLTVIVYILALKTEVPQ